MPAGAVPVAMPAGAGPPPALPTARQRSPSFPPDTFVADLTRLSAAQELLRRQLLDYVVLRCLVFWFLYDTSTQKKIGDGGWLNVADLMQYPRMAKMAQRVGTDVLLSAMQSMTAELELVDGYIRLRPSFLAFACANGLETSLSARGANVCMLAAQMFSAGGPGGIGSRAHVVVSPVAAVATPAGSSDSPAPSPEPELAPSAELAARADLEQTRAKLEQTRAELEQTRSDLEQTRSELEQTQSASRATIETLEKALEAARAEMTELTATYTADLKAAAVKYNKATSEQQQKHDKALKDTLGRMRKEERKALAADTQALRAQKKHYEDVSIEERRRADVAEAKLREAETKLREATDKLGTGDDSSAAKERLERARSEAEALRNKHQQVTRQLSKVQSRLERAERARDAARSEAVEEREKKKKAVSLLKTVRADFEDKLERISALEKASEKLKDDKARAESETATLHLTVHRLLTGPVVMARVGKSATPEEREKAVHDLADVGIDFVLPPRPRFRGGTALTTAVRAGHFDTVYHIVTFRKGSVNVADHDGVTPLSHAVQSRNKGIADWLISKGAVPLGDAEKDKRGDSVPPGVFSKREDLEKTREFRLVLEAMVRDSIALRDKVANGGADGAIDVNPMVYVQQTLAQTHKLLCAAPVDGSAAGDSCRDALVHVMVEAALSGETAFEICTTAVFVSFLLHVNRHKLDDAVTKYNMRVLVAALILTGEPMVMDAMLNNILDKGYGFAESFSDAHAALRKASFLIRRGVKLPDMLNPYSYKIVFDMVKSTRHESDDEGGGEDDEAGEKGTKDE
jgi:hypothetical protein